MVGGVFTTVLEGNAVEQMPPLFSLLYRGNADGIHVQCRFCDHKPFNSVHCPPSARPNYQDGECWFPQGTAQVGQEMHVGNPRSLGSAAPLRRCCVSQNGDHGFGEHVDILMTHILWLVQWMSVFYSTWFDHKEFQQFGVEWWPHTFLQGGAPVYASQVGLVHVVNVWVYGGYNVI